MHITFWSNIGLSPTNPNDAEKKYDDFHMFQLIGLKDNYLPGYVQL
jgi:hypothetical protein